MSVTDYHTVNGRIIGETTSGVRTDFYSDVLGSVTATASSSGVVQNTYRYKPYGSSLSSTGTSPNPKYQWIGSPGYRDTALNHAEEYARARTLSTTDARWTSVDPAWPDYAAYLYAYSNPMSFFDFSGLAPQNPTQASITGKGGICQGAIITPNDPGILTQVIRRTTKRGGFRRADTTVVLPRLCTLNTGLYYNFWMAFSVKYNVGAAGKTYVDCGASVIWVQNVRCWKAYIHVGHNKELTSPCPDCIPGFPISIRLSLTDQGADCWVNRHHGVEGFPSIYPQPDSAYVRTAVGAQCAASGPPAHSPATFGQTYAGSIVGPGPLLPLLQKDFTAAWATFPYQPCAPSFPLMGKLPDTAQNCDCSGKNVPPAQATQINKSP